MRIHFSLIVALFQHLEDDISLVEEKTTQAQRFEVEDLRIELITPTKNMVLLASKNVSIQGMSTYLRAFKKFAILGVIDWVSSYFSGISR